MTKTLSILELFEYISETESITFEPNVEYIPQTPIKITNEFGKMVNVTAMITKVEPTCRLFLYDHGSIDVAIGHKLMTRDFGVVDTKELNRLYFDTDELWIKGVSQDYLLQNIKLCTTEQTFYDLEVDNESHLYSDAMGIIHHNTLITAGLIKYANDMDLSTITVVPSSSLLKQTIEYVEQFGIEVGKYGDGEKNLTAKNIVATWQTLQNDKAFISKFDAIFWDECHTAKAYVAKQILEHTGGAVMRLGLTGTIPKDPLDKKTLQSAFGPILHKVEAHDLQSKGILSTIDIECIQIKYGKKYKMPFLDWHEESMWLQTNDKFVSFAKDLVELLGKDGDNVLFLMKNIEPCAKLAEALGLDFIDSGLSLKKRQVMFDKFQHKAGYKAVGTYSLLSTGLDLVFVDKLILGPSIGKSYIKTIQSVGRGIRRKEGLKEHLEAFDLSANTPFEKKHAKERQTFYKEAKYPYSITEMDLDDD